MATIDIRRTVSLDAPVQVESLSGVAFTAEAGAHRFVISARKDGEAVALTGSVVGAMILADGTSYPALSGSIESGAAVLTLPAAAYGVPGRFQLAIFATGGGVRTVVYAAIGTILRSSTDSQFDPGAEIPSATTLAGMIADLEAALDDATEQATHSVQYTAQTLEDAEKLRARSNIEAASQKLLGVAYRSANKTPVDLVPTSSLPFGVISGNINSTNGADITSSIRARTKYFNVTPGKSYYVELTDEAYNIITACGYSGAGASYFVRNLTSGMMPTVRSFWFKADANMTCIRASFSKADSTQTMDATDYAAILAAFVLWEMTDETLTQTGVPADAKATGLAMESAVGCRPIGGWHSGGYIVLNGETADITAPFAYIEAPYRWTAVPCVAGDRFTINADGQNVARAYGFISADGTVLETIGGTAVAKDLRVTAPENAAYLVINDRAGLTSYYGWTSDYALDALNDLEFNQTLDWDRIQNYNNAAYTLGWRKGYWNASGSFTDSDDAISWWTYLSRTHQIWGRSVCEHLLITVPDGYRMRVYAFDFDSGELKETHIFRKSHHLRLIAGRRYRFTLLDVANPADCLTEAFISGIIFRWHSTNAKAIVAPGAGAERYFSVTVKRPVAFGDTNAEIADAEIECVYRLPTTYTHYGKPTRLILMAHGAHGYIQKSSDTWYSDAWTALCDDLVAAGYGVFDCNTLPGTNAEWNAAKGTSGLNWVGYGLGSPLYIQAVKAAYDYMVSSFNVHPQIFVHGTSMGGTGATAFAHAFPQLVLAESSFAGRDTIQYVRNFYDWYTTPNHAAEWDDGRAPTEWGYANTAELIADRWSHIEGVCPSLSMARVNDDGTLTYPPERNQATEADFVGVWAKWYKDIFDTAQGADTGNWIGWRRVPYKAWNSWGDLVGATKLEQYLRNAYTRTGCPYYAVEYANYGHDDMCFGQSAAVAAENLPGQLIAWFKRWE